MTNMIEIFLSSLNLFLMILQVIVVLFIFCLWLFPRCQIRIFLYILLEPILTPIQSLIGQSVLNHKGDLSPILSFILLRFLQNFIEKLI